jgi:dTDP-4-dehydrorhamnose reductase
MAKVLVTGATGLLGCSLVPLLQERGHQVTSMGHTHASDLNLDLTSYEQTARALDQANPEVIVNLTALTNVDRCETQPQEAYLLNVKTVENLCAWIKTASQACHLIQISTDQVYDGPGPHAEGELTIRNYYGMSKLAGEFVVGTVPVTILRTNFVGRSQREGRASLTDWLHGALHARSSVNVFDDVMFSPVAISTLCDCIERCIVERPFGVFNLGSRDGMSKADFAFAFAAALGLETTNLKRVNFKSNSTLVAHRPTDMRMNSGRYEACMGIKLPSLIDEVFRLADDYV